MTGTKNAPSSWCWDSSIFIAWFAEEEDKDLESIELAIGDVEARRVNIYVPTVVVHEVHVDSKDHGFSDRFDHFLMRENVYPIDLDVRIARLSADFRYQAKKANEAAKRNKPKTLKGIDSIVLATAVTYGASEVNSTDPDILNAYRSRQLLDLVIRTPVPVSGQKTLRWTTKDRN